MDFAKEYLSPLDAGILDDELPLSLQPYDYSIDLEDIDVDFDDGFGGDLADMEIISLPDLIFSPPHSLVPITYFTNSPTLSPSSIELMDLTKGFTTFFTFN